MELKLRMSKKAAKVLTRSKRQPTEEECRAQQAEVAAEAKRHEEVKLKKERDKAARKKARLAKVAAIESDKILAARLKELLEATERAKQDHSVQERKKEYLAASVTAIQAKIKSLNAQIGDLTQKLADTVALQGLHEMDQSKQRPVEELTEEARSAWKDHESSWEPMSAAFRKKNRDRKVRALARRLLGF